MWSKTRFTSGETRIGRTTGYRSGIRVASAIRMKMARRSRRSSLPASSLTVDAPGTSARSPKKAQQAAPLRCPLVAPPQVRALDPEDDLDRGGDPGKTDPDDDPSPGGEAQDIQKPAGHRSCSRDQVLAHRQIG